ncbi:unnamed protein product [Danaus chrysippus]|uniref:(African queen) hypothetical protein n=1 Tax=Danaus chrysippus TaxID=151541 RepID=A0A8J2QUD7_9NEOP|nr:unnamed protein product [Danaus chrysippus]
MPVRATGVTEEGSADVTQVALYAEHSRRTLGLRSSRGLTQRALVIKGSPTDRPGQESRVQTVTVAKQTSSQPTSVGDSGSSARTEGACVARATPRPATCPQVIVVNAAADEFIIVFLYCYRLYSKHKEPYRGSRPTGTDRSGGAPRLAPGPHLDHTCNTWDSWMCLQRDEDDVHIDEAVHMYIYYTTLLTSLNVT